MVDVLMDAMFGRKACLRELERGLLWDRGEPVEEVGLRLIDEAVRSPVDDGHDAVRLIPAVGHLSEMGAYECLIRIYRHV